MLDLRNIHFSYNNIPAIENISFTIQHGAHVSIIGESGCGKSTLLKLIYGLYDLDSGQIIFNGNLILGPKYNLIPGVESMKYLAQDFGLMPYISVEENIGKYLSNIYKDKKRNRVKELLNLVDMTEFASTKVQFLSGGQQQRVAIAKAIALEPEVLLLDEPFSQIDVFRSNKLRRNLFSYCKEKSITCIIATHDPSDVLSFSDEVVVMKAGKVLVKGNPIIIYKQKIDFYTASLFSEVNQFSIRWFDPEAEEAVILIYPHELIEVSHSTLQAVVRKSFFKGNHFLIESVFKNTTIFSESKTEKNVGDIIFLSFEQK